MRSPVYYLSEGGTVTLQAVNVPFTGSGALWGIIWNGEGYPSKQPGESLTIYLPTLTGTLEAWYLDSSLNWQKEFTVEHTFEPAGIYEVDYSTHEITKIGEITYDFEIGTPTVQVA